MPDNGLKADELAQLQRWGSGLRSDPRPEVAAAGKAIELLIEEIDRLHVLIWNIRLYPETTGNRAKDGSLDDALIMRLPGTASQSQSESDPQQEPRTGATFHRPSTDAPGTGSF